MCERGDKVVLETRHGLITGRVSSFGETIKVNPFENGNKYRATKHVVENITQNIIYEGEYINMSNSRTVEVHHLNTQRTYILNTTLELQNGDVVVFECGQPAVFGDTEMMSVGVVIDLEPTKGSANLWIVSKVDMDGYFARRERMRKAEKLKGQLNEKKKQFQDFELLNLIAKNDPETKQMLDEYMELIGK